MKILGIETSCDETSAAVVEVIQDDIKVLSNLINSQVDIHAQYGGVVPEVAARQHSKNIIPIIKQALIDADLNFTDINLIAVTAGPGLVGSLMVGLETAKTIALVNNIPLIETNHLLGHLWSWQLKPLKEIGNLRIKFPYLGLIVSGGHTELILVEDFGKYKILGRTIDDAVGEAFDKVAKILGLTYPGGPEISKHAANGKNDRFILPRPMTKNKNLNFSFAGLKTAVLYKDKEVKNKDKQYINDMSASFETAVIDTLIQKLKIAVTNYPIKIIAISGGVSANKKLRTEIKSVFAKNNIEVKIPEIIYTGDNAAMIALAGYLMVKNKRLKQTKNFLTLSAQPNMKIV